MRQLLSLIGGVGLATAAVAAPPPGVTNAKIETRSGAAGLLAVVKAELTAGSGPAWLGWSVPTTDRGSSCCWSVAPAPRVGSPSLNGALGRRGPFC